MKLWRHFTYRRRRWNVFLASQAEIQEACPDDEALAGLTIFCERRVLISARLGPRNRMSTLLHEFLHVIDEERGLDLSHDAIYKLENDLLPLLMREKGWGQLFDNSE